MRAFPVTNEEYLAFLNDLVRQDRVAEAMEHGPRERVGSTDAIDDLIFGFDGTQFFLRPDADGDVWRPDAPIVLINWLGARAFAEWEAARSGLSWRLPDELRWEKAARGVDGRIFPWGDFFDPSWACLRGGHRGRPLPACVDSFEVDTSVYGVRGCAGNVRDWCDSVHLDRVSPAPSSAGAPGPAHGRPGTMQVLRGGAWFGLPEVPRVADRYGGVPESRNNMLGFRIARGLPIRL